MENSDIVSTKEIAKILRVSVATIDNWRRDGVIPSRKVGGKRIYFRNEVLESIKSPS